MKKTFKRAVSVVSAAAVSLALVPIADYSFFSDAADQYSVRDPFYNYGSGYNYYESEHFQFIWGNSGDSAKVTNEFLQGNAQNLENVWNVYMNDLGMEPPSQSTNLSLRDGKQYKTNIYISGTGLSGMADDWAYMSYDSGGYAYMFCCVDSMQYNPPSWVLPHEFGHVMTAHQLGWNSNKYSYAWWEALGNWYREQYLYSDYSTDETGHGTDFFETYMRNLCFTFPSGRDYYAAWPFLQYLTENPEDLPGYGSDFVKTMLQKGKVDEFPFDQVDRLADADIKDTLGYFAAHMAGLDFKKGDSYRARLNELLANGDWNWQQIYTMLEPTSSDKNVNCYTVPTERAPQFAGMNIVPLEVSGGDITAELEGLTDRKGADWRACIVQQADDGSCTYSRLFKSGEKVSVPYSGGKVYLAVIATPDLDTVTKYGLPGIYDDNSTFSESNVPFSSKERYPYAVTLSENVSVAQRTISTTSSNWWEQAEYNRHPNGGGLVASTANVDSSVYVAPNAIVKGSATVSGNVKILDHAVVEGSARVSDSAVISGYAIVAENAVVSGNARVDDYAGVMGRANISGNAKVIESACVYGNTTMRDNSIAKGCAYIMADSSLSANGVGDGDLYTDNNISFTKGVSCGWTCAQSYTNSRPSEDKLMYAYDFDNMDGKCFTDRYNTTYSTSLGAEWEAERTSAKGVITSNPNSQNSSVIIDKGVLYTKDTEIQFGIISRDTSGSEQTVMKVGSDSNYLSLTIKNGDLTASFKADDKLESITVPRSVTPGEWAKVRIILNGDNGTVFVNDSSATGTITIDPQDIADSAAANSESVVGSLCGNFDGSIDFARFYSAEAAAPSEVYTEKENLNANKKDILVGDVNFDGKINALDISKLRYTVTLTGAMSSLEQRTAKDINGDGSINVADLVLLQSFILGKDSDSLAGTIVTIEQ